MALCINPRDEKKADVENYVPVQFMNHEIRRQVFSVPGGLLQETISTFTYL